MSDLEPSLKANHAAVYLTLVSVVVALAFEDLLSQVRESPDLWKADAAAVRLWLKVSVAFVAAFGLWVGYSSLVVSLHWILGIWDAAQVFLLAVFLYALNSLAFFDTGHPLLYVGGLFISSGNVVLLANLKRAQRYRENRVILERSSYRSPLAFGFMLGGVALLLAVYSHARLASPVAESAFHLAFSVGLFVWLSLFVRAWRRSVSELAGEAA
jgi:hypothetical protein